MRTSMMWEVGMQLPRGRVGRASFAPAGARAAFLSVPVLLALLTIDSAAQLPGLPSFTDPFRASPARSHSVLFAVAHAADDAGEEGALSWTAGLRARPLDRVTVHIVAGAHYPLGAGGERTVRPQLGVGWDVLLLGSYITLGLHNGVGYRAAEGGEVFTIPVGVGITGVIPVIATGAGPKIALWGLPRWELVHRGANGVSETDATLGASFGISLVTSDGLGINLGGDYRDVGDLSSDRSLPHVPDWSWALMLRLRR